MAQKIKYLLNAQTSKYKKLLENTKKDIAERIHKYKNPSVSFSGGKDSTVLLDLIASERKDLTVFYIDSGATFPDTIHCIEHYATKYKIITQPSVFTYQEIYKMREKKEISDIQWMRWLVYMPARKFAEENKIDVQCIGLRAKESKRRDLRFKVYSHERVQLATNVTTYYPLKDWSYMDIWTYIYQQNLFYNTLYDKWREMGVPDSLSRVDSYLECEGHGNRTLDLLKKYYPNIYTSIYTNHREFI